ncbi:DUF2617 family protein [Kocuria sp.]|uniref:DUF2617 family protein n=1 Tax=Kocuria sp. TaxID=1871328 RepID=UPI0026DF465E|nr:DUF2617 family protein [Kocuria sp.]MDO5617821.1 DUF2617 family protein [Kocuria sp.]
MTATPAYMDALRFDSAQVLLPAQASRTVDLPGPDGATVELRLVESGHQVVIALRGHRWVETFTVPQTSTALLPITEHRDHPTSGSIAYEARCTVTEHSQRGLQRQRARVEQVCSASLGYISQTVGTDLHTAGLCIFGFNDDDEIRWRSWYCKPQDNRLVQTTSTVWLSAFDARLRRAS